LQAVDVDLTCRRGAGPPRTRRNWRRIEAFRPRADKPAAAGAARAGARTPRKNEEADAMKIGFIGLGIMGRWMAGHLADAGHELFTVTNRNPVPENLTGKVTECASAKEVAEAAEVIILMVPDTPDVEKVLFTDGGVHDGLKDGKIVVDMSSISPTDTKAFAAKVKEAGAGYLDAPVSGGEGGAKNAQLTIMVGGAKETFETVKPLFDIMGGSVTLVGESNGDGQTCKVANQIVVALTIEAVGEALTFASKAGADPEKVRQALLGGLAQSKILEVHGQRMIDRSFDPGFRIELHQKDLNLALQAAKNLGVSLPNTAGAQELFNVCNALGGQAWDHSGMVKALEHMAQHKVKED
jgi:2-hydroxy-3-oxopropionate reductase